MTDYPRFEPCKGSPETMHLSYHGGALVASVLWLADKWALRRSLAELWSGRQARSVRRARQRVLLTGLILLAAVLLTALWAPGRQAGNRPASPHQPPKVAFAPT
jgi:uncharacterized BrkB/YihY/UPF0761 family membrane protein